MPQNDSEYSRKIRSEETRQPDSHFSRASSNLPALFQAMCWISTLLFTQHEILCGASAFLCFGSTLLPTILMLHMVGEQNTSSGNAPLTSLQCSPMKNEALFSGADETPSSSTGGIEDGSGLGSTYGRSLKTAPLLSDILQASSSRVPYERSI